MLFRMYDVIFAEGAAETIMRVALSLMQKNQARLLACAELEDAIQLLLSRGLWDCYHYNADEFVLHFLSQSSVVTRDRLAALDQAYREAQIARTSQTGLHGPTDRSSTISTIASRFLGRLWTASSYSSSPSPSTAAAKSSASGNGSSSPKNQGLGFAAGLTARPLSLLQRSSSKNSIASTVNSMEAGSSATGPSSSTTSSSSSSVLSSTSTDATSVSRDSASDFNASAKAAVATAGRGSNSKNADNDRYLHSQIEDLLTALSALQREHAVQTEQLQREREERGDDHKAVWALLQGLRGNTSTKAAAIVELSMPEADLQALLEPVEARLVFVDDGAQSSADPTKAQLRIELARTKEQLASEQAKSQESARQVYDMEQEVSSMKEQLRESHAHARVLHQDKQRLERQMHDLRVRYASEATSAALAAAGGVNGDYAGSSAGGNGTSDAGAQWHGHGMSGGGGSFGRSGVSGLREFKLGRSKSTPSQASASSVTGGAHHPHGTLSMFGGKRASSQTTRGHGRNGSAFSTNMVNSNYPAVNEDSVQEEQQQQQQQQQQPDALVLELVQAKTAEAVARQEAEEAKQKLESLRKALGLSANDMASMLNGANAGGAGAAASAAAATAAATKQPAAEKTPAAAPAKSSTSSTGYGFFGWRK
ncbi:MAG: hypothetical protein STHCBS139747_005826 [Sporothrix thermara]